MKFNLKNFPPDEGSSIEEAVYIAPYQIWKEAFEKELREIYENLGNDNDDAWVKYHLMEILGE